MYSGSLGRVHQQDHPDHKERRQAVRLVPKDGSASITSLEGRHGASGPLVDVSIRGFYIESRFAVPLRKRVRWTLRFGNEELTGEGTVQSCHPNLGNGVEITFMTDETRARLVKILQDMELSLLVNSAMEATNHSVFQTR